MYYCYRKKYLFDEYSAKEIEIKILLLFNKCALHYCLTHIKAILLYNLGMKVFLNILTFFFWQSAIFNFQSLLTVILLLICTCTYIRSLAPNLFDKRLGKVGYVNAFIKHRQNIYSYVWYIHTLYIFNEFLILVFRVLFGNVLGLVKEKARTWLFVVSVWPLVFYFGRNIPTSVGSFWPMHLVCIPKLYLNIFMYLRSDMWENKKQFQYPFVDKQLYLPFQ